MGEGCSTDGWYCGWYSTGSGAFTELLFPQFISSSTEGSNFRFLGKFRTGACVGVCWTADWALPLLALPKFVGLAMVMFGVGCVDD